MTRIESSLNNATNTILSLEVATRILLVLAEDCTRQVAGIRSAAGFGNDMTCGDDLVVEQIFRVKLLVETAERDLEALEEVCQAA